ncbi:hypothetical protein [Streptomonospora litoralis]|uniref:Uncharacterized protein n=1 Tax=Streptomonospora litoralis TaxID=2498135 RepID=A0A4P6Q0S9_9ACTN|nr:hypothetical protein [Streptomonospora litoralis]QBI54158.1 hypothetical protein EKD16_11875 [Streptomonospora litoralis]
MTVETPPSGIPGLSASGHRLDGDSSDPVWVRVLSGLTAELRSCGLEARVDGTIGAVDAITRGPAPRVQKAVLRPHRGQLWWWLHCAAEPALPPPHRTPLTPAVDTADAARRIVRVLTPCRD